MSAEPREAINCGSDSAGGGEVLEQKVDALGNSLVGNATLHIAPSMLKAFIVDRTVIPLSMYICPSGLIANCESSSELDKRRPQMPDRSLIKYQGPKFSSALFWKLLPR